MRLLRILESCNHPMSHRISDIWQVSRQPIKWSGVVQIFPIRCSDCCQQLMSERTYRQWVRKVAISIIEGWPAGSGTLHSTRSGTRLEQKSKSKIKHACRPGKLSNNDSDNSFRKSLKIGRTDESTELSTRARDEQQYSQIDPILPYWFKGVSLAKQ